MGTWAPGIQRICDVGEDGGALWAGQLEYWTVDWTGGFLGQHSGIGCDKKVPPLGP